MGIDNKQIRKALDSFENDKFMDAKEILSKEFKSTKEDFIEKKLGLKNPITPKEE